MKKLWIALLEGLCGESRDFVSHQDIEGAAERVEQYLTSLPRRYRWALKLLAWVLELSIWPLSPKWKRFSRLSIQQKVFCLQNWQNSRSYHKQLLLRAIKSVLLIQLFSSPELLAKMKYQGRNRCPS